jgi:hypothetical protein
MEPAARPEKRFETVQNREPAMVDAALAVTPDAPPDWSAIGWDVRCPLCSYNLRGLNLPRCPECGYRFEWQEVLDPRRREHPYLFEHHPERNAWSFRKTTLGALRPKRFWTSLHPVMPSRPKRLFLYYMIGLCIFGCAGLLLLVAPGVRAIVAVYMQRARLYQLAKDKPEVMVTRYMGQPSGSVDAWVNAVEPGPRVLETLVNSLTVPAGLRMRSSGDLASAFRIALATALIWPWATFASLMVFRISMRRARVATIHVARCVVYGFDPLPLTIVGFLAAVGVSICSAPMRGSLWSMSMLSPQSGVAAIDEETMLSILLLVGSGTMLFCCYRLWRAYQLYLRFDRPFWTLLASQAIVLLIFLNALLAYTIGWQWPPW